MEIKEIRYFVCPSCGESQYIELPHRTGEDQPPKEIFCPGCSRSYWYNLLRGELWDGQDQSQVNLWYCTELWPTCEAISGSILHQCFLEKYPQFF